MKVIGEIPSNEELLAIKQKKRVSWLLIFQDIAYFFLKTIYIGCGCIQIANTFVRRIKDNRIHNYQQPLMNLFYE